MSVRGELDGFVKVMTETGNFTSDERGLQIGFKTISLNPSSVAADSTLTESYSVSGLSVGDAVFLLPLSDMSSLMIAQAYVSAENTLRVTYENETAGAIDLASTNFLLVVIRLNK